MPRVHIGPLPSRPTVRMTPRTTPRPHPPSSFPTKAGWTGEFYHTDHVHSVAENSEYACYDRDVTDHVGKCSDTLAGTDCAAAFAEAATFEADSCPTAAPENCAWTAAPVAPNPKPAHPVAASFDGYTHKSGACRSTAPDRLFDESAKMTGRPAYLYRKRSRCEKA